MDKFPLSQHTVRLNLKGEFSSSHDNSEESPI
jgi:hypothetical protein